MSDLKNKKTISTVSAVDFIGRTRELDAILRHAKSENSANGLLLLSAPALGSSELLKQTYDQLFYEQSEIVPFYFALKRSDKNAKSAAIRFLQSFILQLVTFRRQDAKILDFGGDLYELAQFAVPSDGHWIDRLLETCRIESKFNDDRAFIKSCLSAPLRAAANNVKVFVMFDDLHEADHLTDEIDFIEELNEIFARSAVPFVFAGRRRFLSEKRSADFETFSLEPLSFSDAGLLTETLAQNLGVKINEQTRDLISIQFDAKPLFINFLIQSASDRKIDLDSFHKVQQVYTDEIFGGRIAGFYNAMFDEISQKTEIQKNILGLMFDTLTIEREKTPIESWQTRIGLKDAEYYRVMSRLNFNEFVRLTSNQVEAMRENKVLTDYISARFRLEILVGNRALTVGETLSSFIKRAPKLMSGFYRKNSAIGLRELMSVFNRQQIPLNLIDYSRFRTELKGATKEEISKILSNGTQKIQLPQIVYTAHTLSFYPQIEQNIERERSAVAIGFLENNYTDEDETVWIAAEIDSKLEANKELTEFWCDRLEVVALMCNFLNYKIWIVSPEGFSPEALDVLRNRDAFGSSRKQVEMLVEYLQAEDALGEKIKPNEYEMVVPMGEDTEMLAAQTVEEIAKRHHFAPKAITQIKTALVEACINASEHSLSPDRKIYQKFAIENDKLVITISNRGLRLANKQAQEINPDEGRRGWGLKLMKTLMDDVKFEQMDDGTRISMTKYIKN